VPSIVNAVATIRTIAPVTMSRFVKPSIIFSPLRIVIYPTSSVNERTAKGARAALTRLSAIAV
jgi:hypothetical protein